MTLFEMGARRTAIGRPGDRRRGEMRGRQSAASIRRAAHLLERIGKQFLDQPDPFLRAFDTPLRAGQVRCVQAPIGQFLRNMNHSPMRGGAQPKIEIGDPTQAEVAPADRAGDPAGHDRSGPGQAPMCAQHHSTVEVR